MMKEIKYKGYIICPLESSSGIFWAWGLENLDNHSDTLSQAKAEINSLKNIAKSIKLDYEAVMAGQSNLNEELLENEFKMIANKLGVDPIDLWQEYGSV
jgi:hypothetical protein